MLNDDYSYDDDFYSKIPVREEIHYSFNIDLARWAKKAANIIGKDNVQKLFQEQFVVIRHDEYLIMSTKAQITDSFMKLGHRKY